MPFPEKHFIFYFFLLLWLPKKISKLLTPDFLIKKIKFFPVHVLEGFSATMGNLLSASIEFGDSSSYLGTGKTCTDCRCSRVAECCRFWPWHVKVLKHVCSLLKSEGPECPLPPPLRNLSGNFWFLFSLLKKSPISIISERGIWNIKMKQVMQRTINDLGMFNIPSSSRQWGFTHRNTKQIHLQQ